MLFQQSYLRRLQNFVGEKLAISITAIFCLSMENYANAEFSATEIAKMCGGITSQTFSADGGEIAYDNNGIRIIGAEGEVRIENEGGALLTKIDKFTADDYSDCLVKMRSLDLDALIEASKHKELQWSRDLNTMVGSPEGNLPVVRIDLELNADRAPYNSPYLSEIVFRNLSCDVRIWIDRIVVPEFPTGIGGVGLTEASLPQKTMVVKKGSSGIALNFHSTIVVDGFARQQRIAMEAGDRNFATAAVAFRRSYADWSKSQNAWVTLAIAAPSEGCKGNYLVRYPVSRRTIEETTQLIE